MTKLIFGCGYLGRRVAARWLSAGHRVLAVTRSAERAGEFVRAGIEPLLGDVTSPGLGWDLPPLDTVLWAVGYDRRAGVPMSDVYVEGFRRGLDCLPADTGRIIYISSTGVFGQDDGQWVDERSVCEPTREGGRACLEAERYLAHHPLGQRAIILRLAGIYGPGRLPRRQELLGDQPLAVPTGGFLNLIHVDDAVQVVLAAESRAEPPELFLVADGAPVVRADYFRELARLLGVESPRFERPAADDPRAVRALGDKRISNRKLRERLGIELRYPSYRQGLAASLAAEGSLRASRDASNAPGGS